MTSSFRQIPNASCEMVIFHLISTLDKLGIVLEQDLALIRRDLVDVDDGNLLIACEYINLICEVESSTIHRFKVSLWRLCVDLMNAVLASYLALLHELAFTAQR